MSVISASDLLKQGSMDVKQHLDLASIFSDLGYTALTSIPVLISIKDSLLSLRSSNNNVISANEIARCLLFFTTSISNNTFKNSSIDALSAILSKDLLNEIKGSINNFNVNSWNISNFVLFVKNHVSPKLKLHDIILSLDQIEFIKDINGLTLIFDFINLYIDDPTDFPIYLFFRNWNNSVLQFQFLKYIVQNHSSIIIHNKFNSRLVIPLDELNLLPRSQQPVLNNQPWNSLDLIETLVILSDCDSIHDDIKELFESGIQHCPEFILLGLVQLTTPWNKLRKELTPSLVMLFVTGHPYSSFALPRLWQLNQTLAMTGLVHLYHKDPTSISRILDIAQEMKALPQILEAKNHQFSIDLASLASRRDYLNLEKWLHDHISQEGVPFVESILAFLNDKLNARKEGNSKRSVALSADAAIIFLRILSSSINNSSPILENKYTEILNECLTIYPKIQYNGNNFVLDGEENGNVNNNDVQGSQQQAQIQQQNQDDGFTEDIEKEANKYFSKIYKGESSIPETIELLLRFRSSPNTHEQDVYKCMIRDLFEEYKFFDRYPDKELGITSILFGTMIAHQVVTAKTLGIALRYVLDALRQPAGSRIFRFGIQALGQFQSRLIEWPQYCALILQIEDLHQTHPQLIQAIQEIQQEYAISQQQSLDGKFSPQSRQQQLFMQNNNTNNSQNNNSNANINNINSENAPFVSINPDALRIKLLQIESSQPPEQIRDKILFAINNVSFENLEAKVNETKDLLIPPFFDWFADYLVVKRASIEPNFHKVYIEYLKSLQSQELEKQVIYETLSNIKTLLNSPKTVTSSQERSLLKNLGTWLGGITLAQGKPIQHRYLSFKDLLLEGYYNNKLIVVIPFVCKVLEQCQDNFVFKPPNPWLMAIMRLLTELFHTAHLKLNLKFEVEVLCKNLKLDIKEIVPTSLLLQRNNNDSISSLAKGFEQLSTKDGQPLVSGNVAGAPDAYGVQAYAQQQQVQQQHQLQQQDIGIDMLNLAPYIIFNSNIPIFTSQPAVKRIIHAAFDRAIRDIVAPVIERSITIAGIATRELIIKDFALEGDENKMCHAAQSMVSTLAGSLAAVSSREPLRTSMITHLRSLLLQSRIDEQTFPEQAIFLVVEDNLELACSVMEKAVASKAIPDIDETLQNSYLARRLHKQRSNQPYVDPMYTNSPYMSSLPESLRLQPGGLTEQQIKIYDDFTEIATQQQQHHQQIYQQQLENSKHPKEQDLSNLSEENARLQIQQHLEKFTAAVEELKTHTEQYDTQTLEMLGSDHPIRELARKVHEIIAQVTAPKEILLLFAQKLFNMVYKVKTIVSRDILILLASSITESSKRVAREIREWLLYNDDERKFNAPATISLLKAHFISIIDLDSQLYRLTESKLENGIQFAITMIDKCVLDDNSFAFPADFLMTLALFKEMESNNTASEPILKLLNEIKIRFSLSHLRATIATRWEDEKKRVKNKSQDQEDEQPFDEDAENEMIREYLSIIFMDWVHTYYHHNTSHKACDQFVKYLDEQGFLDDKELLPYLLRIGLEISLESYGKARQTAQQAIASNAANAAHINSRVYQALDAYARLIVLLIKHVSESDIETLKLEVANTNSSVDDLIKCDKAKNMTTNALSVVALLLNARHAIEKSEFNQRPFCRIFSTILNDLALFEKFFGPIYDIIICSISDIFHTLQPGFVPGFVFSWLQLISHRNFMPKMLLASDERLWPSFIPLCVDLLKFLKLILDSTVTDAARLLYNGTLRMILVLLHDFPEFLSEYHYVFVDYLPVHCTQAKNLVLSSFPRTIRLPDPFTTVMSIDQIPEVGVPPKIRGNFIEIIDNISELDEYLLGNMNKKATEAFLKSLISKVKIETDGSHYNIRFINALVLYLCENATLGTGAVADLLNDDGQGLKTLIAGTARPTSTNVANNKDEDEDKDDENEEIKNKAREAASVALVIAIKEIPHYVIFQKLLNELDLEGAYITLTAIVNNLRYPNSHTLFFSKLILTVFAETKEASIKEQIIRVLIERLIVVRPHPYGLLLTFVELVRNTKYKFWELDFIRCDAIIERLFSHIAKALSEQGDIRQIGNLYLLNNATN